MAGTDAKDVPGLPGEDVEFRHEEKRQDYELGRDRARGEMRGKGTEANRAGRKLPLLVETKKGTVLARLIES